MFYPLSEEAEMFRALAMKYLTALPFTVAPSEQRLPI